VRRTIPMVEKPFYFPPPPISPDVFIWRCCRAAVL
jgi:hypothetical protein